MPKILFEERAVAFIDVLGFKSLIESSDGTDLYFLEELVEDYNQCKKETIEPITYGDIIWQVQNLHVYERHFHLVK